MIVVASSRALPRGRPSVTRDIEASLNGLFFFINPRSLLLEYPIYEIIWLTLEPTAVAYVVGHAVREAI